MISVFFSVKISSHNNPVLLLHGPPLPDHTLFTPGLSPRAERSLPSVYSRHPREGFSI